MFRSIGGVVTDPPGVRGTFMTLEGSIEASSTNVTGTGIGRLGLSWRIVFVSGASADEDSIEEVVICARCD